MHLPKGLQFTWHLQEPSTAKKPLNYSWVAEYKQCPRAQTLRRIIVFSLQHIQLDGAFPLCPGLLGPGSSNSRFVFYTTEVHCFNLG